MTRTFQIWYAAVLITSTVLPSPISCLEEDAPAIYLSPRHFNPHPFIASFNLRNSLPADSPNSNVNAGGVIFPPSAPPEPDNNNIIDRIELKTNERERIFNHPIDNHPYEKVRKKHKYLVQGRFGGEDDRINPKVYEALSNYAAKVLSGSPTQLGMQDYTPSSLSHDDANKYSFSYKVVNHLSGDDFSHTQTQNSRATNGEYKVKLPDGRIQTVSYIADKNGYKADVKYTENDLPSRNIQIQQRVPSIHNSNNEIRSVVPILKIMSLDYHQYADVDIGRDGYYQTHQLYDIPSKSILLASTPTPPIHYEDYNKYVHFQTHHPQPKVDIFTNTNGINKDANDGYFLSTTAAPYHFGIISSADDYETVRSTVNPHASYYGYDYDNK